METHVCLPAELFAAIRKMYFPPRVTICRALEKNLPGPPVRQTGAWITHTYSLPSALVTRLTTDPRRALMAIAAFVQAHGSRRAA